MKVLKISQQCFMWVGICPITDQTNLRKQWLHNLVGWFPLLYLGSAVVANAVHAATIIDFSNAIYSISTGVACAKVCVSFISMILFPQKVTWFFERLQAFYNQSK